MMGTDVRAHAGRRFARFLLAVAAVYSLLIAGCVTPGGFMMPWDHPDEQPAKIVHYWEHEVKGALNTRAAPLEIEPCLNGRIMFFGGEPSHVVTPRGTLVIDWYDVSGPPNADGKPALLGECVYDPNSFEKFKTTNAFGVGYSVVALWPTYKPEYNRVKITLAFIPERGGGKDILYAEPMVVSLQPGGPQIVSSQRQQMFMIPGAPVTPQAPPSPFGPTLAPTPSTQPGPLGQPPSPFGPTAPPPSAQPAGPPSPLAPLVR